MRRASPRPRAALIEAAMLRVLRRTLSDRARSTFPQLLVFFTYQAERTLLLAFRIWKTANPGGCAGHPPAAGGV